MTWKLFLDDVRAPPDGSWTVARSVAAAQYHIEVYGLPLVMSLDHDLGDGRDAPVLLHLLINRYLDGHMDKLKDVQVTVHSANPQGRENLLGLWTGFLRDG
jgi:hypothetical protein